MAEAKKIIAETTTEEKVAFRNVLSSKETAPKDIQSHCYHCYGELMHGDRQFYLKNTSDDRSKLSSQWGNLRKRFHGRGEAVEGKLIDHLFEKAAEKNPESRLALQDVYTTMCNQPSEGISTSSWVAISTSFTPATVATSLP